MAQDIYAPLEGKQIAIANLSGTFRACSKCGNTTASVSTKPIGMHHGHLLCTRCGNITAWLGRDHMAALLAAHVADQGSPDGGEAA